MFGTMISSLIIVHLLIGIVTCSTQVLRPRGVSLQKSIFYDPSRDFNCVDGSSAIPFVYVNDDYCDCPDGSDEPGTPACLDGVFHCSNLGHISKDIRSSRVNDDICDCCDGSDEYNSSAKCVDICKELGREAYEAARKMEEMVNQGAKIREEMIKKAKEQIEETTQKLAESREELIQIESNKNEKEAMKKDAESREKAALDKYRSEQEAKRQAQEEEEMIKAQEAEKQNAVSAFRELDVNSDGILSYTELQGFSKFDQNGDGTVDSEEAKFFLHMKDEMDLEEFSTTGWIIMKPYYMKREMPESSSEPTVDNQFGMPHSAITTSPPESSQPSTDDQDSTEDDGEENPNDEQEEEDEGPPYTVDKADDTITTESPEQQYDQETLDIIEKAKLAKKEYSEIESRYLELTNNIRELEVLQETDYGSESEFLPLNGQCFEYTDREYTYKFCPFNKASQRPKDGGSETNLGQWGRWSGPDGNKYERMRLENGVQCWNGPSRSVDVVMRCGLQNALVGASEPARCEYQFDFETPALCRMDQVNLEHTHPAHTEL